MKRWLPTISGILAAAASWIVGMRLVHDDLAERQSVGFLGSGQYRFVVFLMLGAAGLAYWLARRLLFGPTLTREEWAVYRDPAPFRLDREGLFARLREYGYRPVEVDDGVRALHRLLVRHADRKHGGVLIDFGNLASAGWGSVEATDASGELHAEMAKYVLLELGRSIPGMSYRGSWSSLTPESTETLEPQLPDRPHELR